MGTPLPLFWGVLWKSRDETAESAVLGSDTPTPSRLVEAFSGKPVRNGCAPGGKCVRGRRVEMAKISLNEGLGPVEVLRSGAAISGEQTR